MGSFVNVDMPVSMKDRVEKYISDNSLDISVDQFLERAVVEFLDKLHLGNDPLTTIRIRHSTKDMIKGFGMFGESYDNAIQNLYAYLDHFKSENKKLRDRISELESD